MNTFLIICGIILLLVVIIINMASSKEDGEMIPTSSVLSFFSGVFIISGVIMLDESHRPSPIDVYRNRTDLQIEYRIINNDTISADSTVVFKK